MLNRAGLSLTISWNDVDGVAFTNAVTDAAFFELQFRCGLLCDQCCEIKTAIHSHPDQWAFKSQSDYAPGKTVSHAAGLSVVRLNGHVFRPDANIDIAVFHFFRNRIERGRADFDDHHPIAHLAHPSDGDCLDAHDSARLPYPQAG